VRRNPPLPHSTLGFGTANTQSHCSLVNASLQFSHLARQKIHKVVSQYKLKIRSSALESISEACCTKFREHILPNFFPEGNTAWNIQVELPPNFPGLENGFLQFTEDEIEGCFKSSVETIIKTALFCVLESYDENRPVAVSGTRKPPSDGTYLVHGECTLTWF